MRRGAVQPEPKDYAFDLDAALSAVVSVHARIPGDAFTAETLGTERAGSGALIRKDGLVLTIGYLITEAESVWLTLVDGRSVEGYVVGFDQESGFGLVQALARLDVPALAIGSSAKVRPGDPVIVAGGGGRANAVAARVVAKHEFAGYWEYLLDEAIFTAPAHENWGGTAVIGQAGTLVGIGSLLVQQGSEQRPGQNVNMVVPIDLLPPILDDLMTTGRVNKPPRPWLGVFATEFGNRVVVANLSRRGPGAAAELRAGDIIVSVGGAEITDLPGFFRAVWRQGKAGCDVPLLIYRDGQTFEVTVKSSERQRYLKAPVRH